MLKGFFNVPKAVNEPVKSYAPNSPERTSVLATYKAMWNSNIDVPLYIGNEEIRTGITKNMTAPFDHKHVVGQYHEAEKEHIEKAIKVALGAESFYIFEGCRTISGSIPRKNQCRNYDCSGKNNTSSRN